MQCDRVILSALVVVSCVVRAGPPPEDADPAALVRQLGGRRFADREAAEQKLLARVPAAKPAVRAGAQDPDAEVARQCRALLERLRDGERAAFLAGKRDWPGPVGRKFRDFVGESDAGRRLFAEVLKVGACWDAVERLEEAPDVAPGAYAAELARLERGWRAALAELAVRPADVGGERLRQEARRRVQPGDVVLLLVLEALRKPADAGAPARLYELLSASFMDLARGPSGGRSASCS